MWVYTWNQTHKKKNSTEHIHFFFPNACAVFLVLMLAAYYFISLEHFIHINVDFFVLNPPEDPGGFLQADWQGIVVQLVYQPLVVLFLFETGRIIAGGVMKTNVIQLLPPTSWNGHMIGFLGLFTMGENYYLIWREVTSVFPQLLSNEFLWVFHDISSILWLLDEED